MCYFRNVLVVFRIHSISIVCGNCVFVKQEVTSVSLPQDVVVVVLLFTPQIVAYQSTCLHSHWVITSLADWIFPPVDDPYFVVIRIGERFSYQRWRWGCPICFPFLNMNPCNVGCLTWCSPSVIEMLRVTSLLLVTDVGTSAQRQLIAWGYRLSCQQMFVECRLADPHKSLWDTGCLSPGVIVHLSLVVIVRLLHVLIVYCFSVASRCRHIAGDEEIQCYVASFEHV